jgi:hypothetical protein
MPDSSPPQVPSPRCQHLSKRFQTLPPIQPSTSAAVTGTRFPTVTVMTCADCGTELSRAAEGESHVI